MIHTTDINLLVNVEFRVNTLALKSIKASLYKPNEHDHYKTILTVQRNSLMRTVAVFVHDLGQGMMRWTNLSKYSFCELFVVYKKTKFSACIN